MNAGWLQGRRALVVGAGSGIGRAVVLRGHGLTSSGNSVQEAVLRAISVDSMARLSLQIASARGAQEDLPAEDLALLPDLCRGFNEGVAWRHEIARMGLTAAAQVVGVALCTADTPVVSES